MAIDAVVSVVIVKLKNLVIQEEYVEVREVMNLLSGIQSFLVDAENNKEPVEEDEFDKWVAEFLKVIYRLEDVIETFYVDKISSRKGRRESLIDACIIPSKEQEDSIRTKTQTVMSDINKEIKACRDDMHSLSFIPRSPTRSNSQDEASAVHSLQGTCSDIKDEEEEIEEEKDDKEEGEAEEEEEEEEEEEVDDAEKDDEAEEHTISGLEKYVETIISQLTAERKSANRQPGGKCKKLQIISVSGEVGSGKTTLAKAICNKRKIKKLFAGNAFWVSVVGEKYEVRDILLNILSQLSSSSLKDEEKKLSDNSLRQRLYECLESKRYLIVIDGVPFIKDVIKELRGALPDKSNGSRVLFTTCHDEIAQKAHRRLHHKLNPLPPQDSWNLFSIKAEPLPHMQDLDLQKEIVKICKSLPLKILMLGGVLSTKQQRRDEWMRVIKEYETFQLSRPVFKCSDVLIFSYNDLPPHLKPCFLYLGLLPTQFEIPVRRLFRLWIAEGFVYRETTGIIPEDLTGIIPEDLTGIIPEDLVQKYLDELVKRHMVEVSKKRSDESVKSCRMLGAFHQVIVSKAVDIGFFYVHRNSQRAPPQFGVRRAVEHIDDSTSSEFNGQNILSYISFNVANKALPALRIGKFLGDVIGNQVFKLLRVLDLEGMYNPSIPEELGLLINLRYLGLRRTLLSTLPVSICDLPYLETLDIKHTYISTLPHSIWKMKHLRHLCLNETRINMPHMHHQHTGESQLQTLWGLFLDKKKSSQGKKGGGSHKLDHLRKLGVTSDPTTLEELGSWIANLKKLKSLRLRSKGKLGRPSDLKLPSFSGLRYLTHLHLIGNLPKQSATSLFPNSLTVVTLSFSLLEEDPMRMLGHLPNLSVLRLLAKSFTGDEMVCPENSFHKLRLLKLWMLEALTSWNVPEGSMQKLQSLEIRLCSKLNEFPDSLLKSSSFKELTLTNMPEDLVRDIRGKRQKHTAITENNWDF